MKLLLLAYLVVALLFAFALARAAGRPLPKHLNLRSTKTTKKENAV